MPVFLCTTLLSSALVKGGIVAVNILVIGALLNATQAICKSLIMHDLALAQKLNGIAHIGVIGQTQNVIIGHAGLLLCCYHIFATFFHRLKIEISLIL